MTEKIFLGLLVFVPIAIVAELLSAPAAITFFCAAIAIVPLAKYIGAATEELSLRTSAAVGGFLNATFGNAPELIIGIFALRAGLLEVVKASITGSIVGNLLFVVGLSMLAGGWKREKQTFNRTAVVAGGSALFIAVIALVVPAIFMQTSAMTPGTSVQSLSVFVAIALLAMYGASLYFSLHTHKHLYIEEVAKLEGRWSVKRSAAVLLLATLAVAVVSEILVGAIEPLVTSLGWSQLFIGVIVIAIIGNAAEHFSAVTIAMKDRMDLSLQIAIGSATQIAMFVAPTLVLLSFFAQPMNLIFNTFELVSIVLSVIIVNLVVADGESNWLEGAQLLGAYAIIAVAFFFHP